ncbi:hypothetical protein ACJX0J_010327, partial [Zea mays]
LPGDDHGAGHPLELHAGHDRRVLRVRGMPSARAGRHGHRRGRRLRPVDSLVRRRLLERRGDRPPPPAPWIPQLPDVLREVPAVCHDGVLVLAPHGRLCHLQPLVRRLTV